ncbi:MAG TPA: guanine deaminase, partial [Turneriella sp.]|nr:guanine deaminase [Turneriella sp.]
MPQKKKGICAAVINPVAENQIEYFDKAYLLWDEQGTLTYFSDKKPDGGTWDSYPIEHQNDKIAIPGLIDLHTHLPQYEFVAQGAEALLPWLEKYTFPQEARFADNAVAREQSHNFFQSCVANGTTTTVAYLSSFFDAAHVAFEEASRVRLRAYLGLTLMDMNVPRALQTKTSIAEKNMRTLIEKFHKKGLNEFVVTPRFAVSCSEEMLRMCGAVSREYDTFLQTHISENSAEVREVAALFPQYKNYTDVYRQTGCLHAKTLLGHGIHLTHEERKIIAETKSVVVHCPTSNTFLGSGIFSYGVLLNENLRLGLGTDVAGGYSLSMFHEAKQAVEMAKLRAHFDATPSALNSGSALYQATLGNAHALGRADELGSFAVGKQADIALIDDARTNPLLENAKNHYASLAERLNRVLYRGHPGMVAQT